MEFIEATGDPPSSTHPAGELLTQAYDSIGAAAAMPDDGLVWSDDGTYSFDPRIDLTDEEFGDEIEGFFQEENLVESLRFSKTPVGPVGPVVPVVPVAPVGAVDAVTAADRLASVDRFVEEFLAEHDLDLSFTSENPVTAPKASEQPTVDQSVIEQLATKQPAIEQARIQNPYGIMPEQSDKGLAGAIGLTLQEVLSGKQNTEIQEPKASGPTMVTGLFQAKNGGFIKCTLPFPSVSIQSQGKNTTEDMPTQNVATQGAAPPPTMTMQVAPNMTVDDSQVSVTETRMVEMPYIPQARQVGHKVTKAQAKKTTATKKKTTSTKQQQAASQLQQDLLQQQQYYNPEDVYFQYQQQQAAQHDMLQQQTFDNPEDVWFQSQQQQAAQHNMLHQQNFNNLEDVRFQSQQQQAAQHNMLQQQTFNNHGGVQSPQQPYYNSPQMIPRQFTPHEMQLSLQAQYHQSQLMMMQAQEQSQMIIAQMAQFGSPQMAAQQGHPQQYFGQNPNMNLSMNKQHQSQGPAFQQTQPQLTAMSHGMLNYQAQGLQGPQGPQMPNGFALYPNMNYSPLPQQQQQQQQKQKQQKQAMLGPQGPMNSQPFHAPPPPPHGPPAKKQRKSRAKPKTKTPTDGPICGEYTPQAGIYWTNVLPGNNKMQAYQKAVAPLVNAEQQGSPVDSMAPLVNAEQQGSAVGS